MSTETRRIRKVLVANRGEVAVRIIRACKESGIRTVAVFSAADRLAPHVFEADEAYPIGGAAASESYLRTDALLDVAHRTGCDAVHPGYGFLAERAPFAQAVSDAGLIFIGPPAAAIQAMGDKTQARRRMMEAGVPVVPGTTEPLVDVAAAREAAESFGYPVLLKAAAGGGGKGMRVVTQAAEMAAAFEGAQREARQAFDDDSVYIEKYLARPRHIEIQVLADHHGTVLHLGERECSVQRRHQKMIEEAPSPVVDAALRARMGAAAVAAASAVGYRNAGTIEFLYDAGEFYFLEMNTRIQVEHPVTEMVFGVDLVQWQLRVANGERLTLRQEDLVATGHAIECRITSEDAAQGFLPSAGRIVSIDVPAGPGVRWDGGVTEGFEVSLFYDPLLGKLIVHGDDRAAAIARMQRALSELRIVGVDTSISFHERVLRESDFRAGNIDIRYVEEHASVLAAGAEEAKLRAAAVAAALLEDERRRRPGVARIAGNATRSAWAVPDFGHR